MNIYLYGHDYKYAVEQMMMTLYPGERPTYPEGLAEGDSVSVRLTRGSTYVTASCRLCREGSLFCAAARAPLSSITDELSRSRIEQRIIKLCFYRAVLRSGHPRPVWGCLTGVRPGKFLTGLQQKDGLSPQQALRELVRSYDVDPARAELCGAAASVSEEVRSRLAPGDICLYVGIPFCPTRCAYCSFVSVDAPKLLQRMPEYLAALEQEMAAVADAVHRAGLRIISVYVGGGTPTTLSAPELRRLICALREKFDLSSCRELTVEAGRPDTITQEKLQVLSELGVDRVSVNPQTMSDEILAAIGRHHTAEDIRRAVRMVKQTPLSMNMDLIAGLPGDTPERFAATVAEVLAMEPENITVHTLALKKGSFFLQNPTALPGDSEVGAMLDAACRELSAAGYEPYYLYRQKYMSGSFENVGWAKKGYINEYNVCIMEELCSILAVGSGGSTKLAGPNGLISRLGVPKYPKEYMDRISELCEAKEEIVRFYTQKGEN